MAHGIGHIAAMADFKEPLPRPIDHCVLPVADLGEARARYEKLGFTVAPEGVHPFGTKNACVYLADGTFLEPLAQADDKVQRRAARQGNVFAARDLAYRFRRGEEGFSAIVFGTGDAAADHAGFVEEGISAGPMLEFSRDFIDGSGKTDAASFKLAFAADLRAPDCFFFTCHRVNVPAVDRSALQRHENGAVRIKELVLAAPLGFGFVDIALMVSNVASTNDFREGVRISASNADLRLLDPPQMQSRFGAGCSDDPGLQAVAIVFQVNDLRATARLFDTNRVSYKARGSTLVVKPAPGQGAIFAFEAR